MANKYKYVCTVFTLFGTAPACVRGSGQRISCMSGTRYRSPGPHPPAGGTRARGHGHGRGGALANQGGTAACLLCRGRKRYALGRAGCWRIRVGRRCPGLPKTRGACLPDKARVCLSGSREAVGCRYGCRPARKRGSGRMPGRLRPDARPAGICVGQSTEPRRRFAGKGCLLQVRALCRACPQK